MTNGDVKAPGTPNHSALTDNEKKIINGIMQKFEKNLEFIQDAHKNHTPKENLKETFGGIIDAYYDLMLGEGASPERAKFVLLSNLRNATAEQFLSARNSS